MARRLINTTYKNSAGDEFTLELWDMESVSADLDHIVELDAKGFSIKWDSQSGDYKPLVGSKCSWTMFLNEAQRSAIMPKLYSDTSEFNLCVLIRKGSAPWWAGMVHAEETSEVIEDGYITVTMGASDGLGMLDAIDFKDGSGNKFTGQNSLSYYIHETLKKLPHYDLWCGTAQVFMREFPLHKPVVQSGSFLFALAASDSNYYGVLDYIQLKAGTFYNQPTEVNARIGTKFLSIAKLNEEGFVSSKEMLTSMMASLGAQMCFAEGSWNVWDWAKTRVDNSTLSEDTAIYSVTSGGLLETSVTSINRGKFLKNAYSPEGSSAYESASDNKFRRGAVRRGIFPYRAASQDFNNAGSDEIHAEGIGYNQFGSPLLRLNADSGNEYNPATASNGADFPDFSGSPLSAANGGIYMHGDFSASDLAIASGTVDGRIRIHMSGDARHNGSDGSQQVNTLRMRVQATDGATTWRLSRPVRTLKYTSTSTSGAPVLAGVTVNGTGGGTYYPKYWQGAYEWIQSTDGRYADAYLEIPLGLSSQIIEGGTAVRFLQTDYPNIEFYAPAGTKLDSADNILTTTNEESYNWYVWRHNVTYNTPNTASTISDISVSDLHLSAFSRGGGPNLLYDINGTLLPIGTDDYGGDTYRTNKNASDTTGFGDRPVSLDYLQISGITVHNGDGTNSYDSTSVFQPDTPKGYEIKNLPSTMVGGTFVNTGYNVYGRYQVASFVTPAVTDDNVKVLQSYDNSVADVSFGLAVCRGFMQYRHRNREAVNCSLIAQYGGTNTILYPYSRLITHQLAGTTEEFAVDSVSYTLLDSEQQLELAKCPSSAEANIAGTTGVNDSSNVGGRGPTGQGNGGSNPNPNDDHGVVLQGKTTAIEDITEHFDAAGMTGQVSITEIQEKINKVQTTNPITDADLGGGGGTGVFGDIFPIFIKRF